MIISKVVEERDFFCYFLKIKFAAVENEKMLSP
jgi:hypothetical protein